MPYFRWLSQPPIPPRFDLRRCGWRLAGEGTPAYGAAAVVVLADAAIPDIAGLCPRSSVMLLGESDPEQRASLLRQGFGDVVGPGAVLAEIEARALRIAASAQTIPRSRDAGRVRLDLLARDGFVDGRPLGLHPREFGVIWRLAETPGMPVAKEELMRQVWRLAHMPYTNSIAVHIFRLRAKLGLAGLHEMVRTAPSGGYFLDLSSALPLAGSVQLPGEDFVDRAVWTGNTALAAIAPRSPGHAP